MFRVRFWLFVFSLFHTLRRLRIHLALEIIKFIQIFNFSHTSTKFINNGLFTLYVFFSSKVTINYLKYIDIQIYIIIIIANDVKSSSKKITQRLTKNTKRG